MVKADGIQSKVHYRAADRDFLVFIDDTAALQKWKSDKSVPLVDVVQSFQVFTTECVYPHWWRPHWWQPPYAQIISLLVLSI